ncbi:MAG: hypothetical protein EOP38_09565 [Rubrivivax sp.]|nr:MAG: hypothetical protein EOP38_09565 [Rubrivivax sp.]
MKGDFSFLAFDTAPHYAGVLHQQGRVLLDRDWNEAAAIAATWQSAAARDAFGNGVLAVPIASITAFKVLSASTDGSGVKLELDAGRAWADGLSITQDAKASFTASYFAPPYQTPQATAATIADGVRDLVVLDVWEDTVSGFQDPLNLIEPALGGPDTTERTQVFANLKLLRLGPNDDCSAAAGLADDFGAKGKLTVSPAPVLTITGDCPLEAGGGYTGLEHYLYRIEVADPDGAGQARFKWSQWNGGLVGRGLYAAGAPGTGTLTITANDQMINHCGVTDFYLEALAFDASLGSWRITMTAEATLSQDGILSLSNVQGPWPAVMPASGFFRLWNGIERIADFPVGGPNPVELKDGIRLEFDAATASNANYQPGDHWTFPVRASGAAFEPPVWPANAPPQGVHHHRVALAILNWNAAPSTTITQAAGQISDCRHPFRPLTNQKVCCTYNVGDGRTSHGDFDSIEEALQHLPASGGEICLLPGLHQTNAVIEGRRNVKIKGCDTKTKVIPRRQGAALPIFTVRDSVNITLEHMDMVTLGGTAIVIGATQAGGVADIEVTHNRILACTNAIRARNARGVNIHHNRIRMLDKRGSDVAIYLAGDDSLIERNDIRLVPALRMPPIDVPTEPDPLDPNDPCAKLDIVYFNPRVFISYVNLVWETLLPHIKVLTQPYRALGGIQLGGGCERVRVLENTVVGGAGNGVTLGDALQQPEPEPEHVFVLPRESGVNGLVLGPDGKPRAGVQITLTDTATNATRVLVSEADGTFLFGSNPATFRVTEGEPNLSIDKLDLQPSTGDQRFQLTITLKEDEAPTSDDTGFLYDISIERNVLNAMGLSGIGVTAATLSATGLRSAKALAVARNQLGTPVVGLIIQGNQIKDCLLNTFDNALRAAAATQGLGGISLGLCEALSIVGNQIEDNGVTGANPVCGIFVAYGEDVEITRNRIVNNGALTPNVNADALIAGRRGGIVLKVVSNFNLLDAEAISQGHAFNQRPAARIHENLVDQPVGLALFAIAFGPVQCTDNAFSSEMSDPSAQERLAGTVYLFDLGGLSTAGAGVQLQRDSTANTAPAPAMDEATGAAAPPRGGLATHAAPTALQPQRDAAVAALFPPGPVMFNDNQSRTGLSNTSTACQVIATLDDLAYQDNQSASLRNGNLFTNGLLMGNTVRATNNRLSERGPETLLSLFTLGVRLVNTSFNQGDHCIVAVDMNPAMAEVKVGNQVLNPNALCASRNGVATLLFKPHG